jgi:DNA-binding transcriptional LysR family regulator
MSSEHDQHPDVPLVALRAFVAAGRHGNFTRAAAAMGVTQGVVSRHVAALERLGGVRLFERRGARAVLTPAGTQLYDAVHDAFAAIELAGRQIVQRRHVSHRLQVRTSMPTLALSVLMPSLTAFTDKHGVQVDLITSLAQVQPRDEFDVLITRDLDISGAESWELAVETLVSVATPPLLRTWGDHAPLRWPMIGTRSRPEILGIWALAQGLPPEQFDLVAVDEHLHLAIARALGGGGVLVAPQLLLLDHLANGALVRLPGPAVPSGETYRAFIHPRTANLRAATAFCRWLKGTLVTRARLEPSQS